MEFATGSISNELNLMPTTDHRCFGSYELLREIGRGAHGVVHEAHHTKLDRTVALKILHSHFPADHNATERFGRESRALARIRHPHIMRSTRRG